MKETRTNIAKRFDRMSTAAVPIGEVMASKESGPTTEPLTLAAFLRKFSEVGLFATLLGAVFAYHLMLPSDLIHKAHEIAGRLMASATSGEGVAAHAQFVRDLVPYLEGGAPVLELKSTVWLICGMFLISGVLLGRLFERLSGQAVFPVIHATAGRRGGWHRHVPVIAVAGFLVWSALSFSPWGWGPRPPEEAILDPVISLFPSWEGAGGVRGWLAGVLRGRPVAGSYHSMVAFLQVGIGLILFLATEELIRTRRLVYKILGLFLGVGVIVAATAVLVKIGAPGLADIWIKWGPAAYRNDMGGFIGHNAAISSFLIFPTLLGITLMLAHGATLPRWTKVLLVVSLVIMATALVLAQSRAVVPILLVSLAVHLWLMARRALVRPRMTFWLATPIVLGFLLLTQFIDHPYNPLYRENLPLAQRVQHLTGEHLLTETRLRITMASLPVIRDNALMGTGFASFQYVYPAAQGRFYEDNPETRIAPTPRRSFHAHNEYLQTLFETGLVGLGLGLAGLIAILWSGWTALRASVRQRHIAVQVAVLVSLCAMLIHALVDFPFRVAPVAASIVILLAVWSAGTRLWVIHVGEMEERDPGAPEDLLLSPARARRLTPHQPPRDWRHFVPHGVVAATSLAVLWAFLFLGTAAGTWYSAAYLSNRGAIALNNYQAVGWHILGPADESLEDATRLAPLMGDALLYRSQIQYLASVRLAEQQTERYRQGLVPTPMISMHGIDRAMELVNQSLAEVRTNISYRHRALLHMFRTVYDPERYNQHVSAALEDLQTAALMNPGDPDGLMMFLSWKTRDPRVTDEELIPYHRLIHRFHRWIYDEEMIPQFHALSTMNEREEAYRIIRPIAISNPEVQRYRLWLMGAAAQAGDDQTALAVAQELRDQGVNVGLVTEALIAARSGNIDRGLALLRTHTGRDPELRPFIDALRKLIEAVALHQRGEEQEAAERFESLYAATDDELEVQRSMALSLANDFGLHAHAAALYRRILENPAYPVYGVDQAALARILVDTHRPEMNRLQRELRTGQTSIRMSDRMRRDFKEAHALYSEARFNEATVHVVNRIEQILPELDRLLAAEAGG